MSTPPAPPRLKIEYATNAPIAVIIRRGPSKWSHLIRWDMRTDKFEPGQWLHGTVASASLSPNGKHLAMQIQAHRSKSGWRDDLMYSLVCRPPYFTAIAIDFKGLPLSAIWFESEYELVWINPNFIEFRTDNQCPYNIIERDPRTWDETSTAVRATEDPASDLPNGRRVLTRDGCLIEILNGDEYLLYDARKDAFAEVETPEWAKNW